MDKLVVVRWKEIDRRTDKCYQMHWLIAWTAGNVFLRIFVTFWDAHNQWNKCNSICLELGTWSCLWVQRSWFEAGCYNMCPEVHAISHYVLYNNLRRVHLLEEIQDYIQFHHVRNKNQGKVYHYSDLLRFILIFMCKKIG